MLQAGPSPQAERRCSLAVEVVERYADGLASAIELSHAHDDVATVVRATRDATANACCQASSKSDDVALSTAPLAVGPPHTDYRAGRKAQAAVFIDMFSNSFRPGPVADLALLAGNGGTIAKLAQRIYDDRAYNRLPLLADALEDAGCTNAELLAHLRGPGPHVRGCWAVDLVLGKE
jgi:hypothetical protein